MTLSRLSRLALLPAILFFAITAPAAALHLGADQLSGIDDETKFKAETAVTAGCQAAYDTCRKTNNCAALSGSAYQDCYLNCDISANCGGCRTDADCAGFSQLAGLNAVCNPAINTCEFVGGGSTANTNVATSDPTDDSVFQRCRVTPTQECCDRYPNTSLGARCQNQQTSEANANASNTNEPTAPNIITIRADNPDGLIQISAVRLRAGAPAAAVPTIQKMSAGGTWGPATADDRLTPGDKLYVDADTVVVLEWVETVDALPSDQSDVTIGANSIVLIDNYQTTQTTITVDSGEVRVQERGGTRSVSAVATPTANVIVDGTDFLVIVGLDKTTTTYVNEGLVTVQQVASGETAALAAGQKVTATTASLTAATPLSTADKALFAATPPAASDKQPTATSALLWWGLSVFVLLVTAALIWHRQHSKRNR